MLCRQHGRCLCHTQGKLTLTIATCDVNLNFEPVLAVTLLCSLRRSSSSHICWQGRLALLRLRASARCSWGGGLGLHWSRGEACPCTSMQLGVPPYKCLLRREGFARLFRHQANELEWRAETHWEWHGLLIP